MPLLKANDFWKPNTYYYATDRYKSLIEKDNTLYICNESHLSQDEFDATKFVGISGSGGSGGLTALQIYSNAVYLNKAYAIDFSSLFFIQHTGNSFDIDIVLNTDNTLSANSDGIIPSQKAIKHYVDNKPIDGGSF